jgi:drug/metabolite transporter (DMT)-like permease
MDLAVIYILISVVGGAVGQLLLKKGMTSLGPLTIRPQELFSLLWRIGTNPYVVTGLLIYVTGTLFWLVALSRVDLSYAYPFASLSYLLMLGVAWLVFKEDISLLRLIGTGVICAGVLIIWRS